MKTIQELLQVAKEKGVKSSYLNTLINGYRGKITDAKNNKTTLTPNELQIIENYLLGNEQKNKPLSAQSERSLEFARLFEQLPKDKQDFFIELIKKSAE